MIAFFITLAQVPTWIIGFMQAIDAGPAMFLLIVNIVFLIAGMFIDPGTAILILVPALFPVTQAHANRRGAFRARGLPQRLHRHDHPALRARHLRRRRPRLNKPVVEVTRGVWPFIVVNIVVLMVVTYVPGIATFLPNLLFGRGGL